MEHSWHFIVTLDVTAKGARAIAKGNLGLFNHHSQSTNVPLGLICLVALLPPLSTTIRNSSVGSPDF